MTKPSDKIYGDSTRGRVESFSYLLIFRQILYLAVIAIVYVQSPDDVAAVIPGNVVNFIAYLLSRTSRYKWAAAIVILEPMIGIPVLSIQHWSTMSALGAPMWLVLGPLIACLVLSVFCTSAVIFCTCLAYLVIGFGVAHESYYLLISHTLVMLSISALALIGTILRDRNDRRMMDQRAQMLHSAKLASLGEMAGGVAHELNSPLAAISLNVEMLTEEISELQGEKEEILGKLQGIGEITDHMAKTINSFRKFKERVPLDAPERLPARSWIDEGLELCQQRVRQTGVELRVVNEGFDTVLKVRGQELSQVFVNLLNNAFDAVSHLSVKWIMVDARIDGQFFELRIADSGAGVPEAFANRLFQPFFTTKVLGEGAGLGLSVSRGILENHGGKLHYERFENTTLFTMRIPLGSEKR